MTHREPLNDSGRLLTLAIRGQRSAEEDTELREVFSRLSPNFAREIARRNQVDALVGVGLMAAGAPVPPDWRAAVDSNARRVTDLLEALRAVVSRLDRAGVPSAAIEAGGVMLATDLPAAGYCPSDIDLLVDERGWDQIPSAFAAEGFEYADRRGRPTKRIEFRRQLADGREMWLEAGCEPFDRMWVPLRFQDRSQAWLARRVPARKDAALHVLEPSDALAFVSLHTSMHSYVRAPGLRLHVDVDRLVRDTPIDWERYISEVAAAAFPRRAFLSLSLASDLLGTPVPGDVLDRLSPPEPVHKALVSLLAKESVVADGRPKLPRLRALHLDLLLNEAGAGVWLGNVLIPPAAWMREHFDREGSGFCLPRLHARRFARLLTRWRPQ